MSRLEKLWFFDAGLVADAAALIQAQNQETPVAPLPPQAPSKELEVVNAGITPAALKDGQELLQLQSGDTLETVKDYLAGRSGYSAIHFEGHGESGAFYVGQTLVETNHLVSLRDDFQAIGQSLTDTGDILIYGCDVASGADGKALVDQIAGITGADVAASQNASGPAPLDNVLEYHSGNVETAPLDLTQELGLATNEIVVFGNNIIWDEDAFKTWIGESITSVSGSLSQREYVTASDRHIFVKQLSASEGLSDVTNYFTQTTNSVGNHTVSKVHIVDLGDSLSFRVGTSVLHTVGNDYTKFQNDFTSWKNTALATNAKIGLYGSLIAVNKGSSSEDAGEILSSIETWTGCKVLASTDKTGSMPGMNFNLEYSTAGMVGSFDELNSSVVKTPSLGGVDISTWYDVNTDSSTATADGAGNWKAITNDNTSIDQINNPVVTYYFSDTQYSYGRFSGVFISTGKSVGSSVVDDDLLGFVFGLKDAEGYSRNTPNVDLDGDGIIDLSSTEMDRVKVSSGDNITMGSGSGTDLYMNAYTSIWTKNGVKSDGGYEGMSIEDMKGYINYYSDPMMIDPAVANPVLVVPDSNHGNEVRTSEWKTVYSKVDLSPGSVGTTQENINGVWQTPVAETTDSSLGYDVNEAYLFTIDLRPESMNIDIFNGVSTVKHFYISADANNDGTVSAAERFHSGAFGFFNQSMGGSYYGSVTFAATADTDKYGLQEDGSVTISAGNLPGVDGSGGAGLLGNDGQPDATRTSNFVEILNSDGSVWDSSDPSHATPSSPLRLAHGSLVVAGSSWTYTPDANWNGTDTAQYRINDGNFYSNIAQVNFVVAPVNDAPEIKVGPTDPTLAPTQVVTTLEDSPLSGQTFATDIDSPTLTYAVSGSASHGSVTVNGATGTWLYTPNANFSGDDHFSVQVSDGGTPPYPSQDITVHVTAVNDAPSGTSKTVVMNEDVPRTLTASDFGFSDVNDTPANNLAYARITSVPGAGSLTLGGLTVTVGTDVSRAALDANQLVYTPGLNANGAGYASFGFKVIDDGGTSNGGVNIDATARAITFNVSAVNDASVFDAGANQNLTVLEDSGATSGSSHATDVDGDTLSYNVNIAAGHGTATVTNAAIGTWTYTPAANYFGADTFTIAVNDGSGTPVLQTVTVTVTSVNDAPSGADKTITVNEDTQRVLTTSDFGFSDTTDLPSANALAAVKISSIPTAGSLSLNGFAVHNGDSVVVADISAGHLIWTPSANANGLAYANFTFQVQDDGGTANSGVNLSTSKTIVFNVTAVNDTPVATSGTATTNEDTAVTSSVTSTDVDTGDTATYTVATNPTNGTVTLNTNGTYTYTPGTDFNGTDTFTYTVTDSSGASSNATVTITVTAVNDAPVNTLPSAQSVNEDTNLPISGLSVHDVDGNLSTVRLTVLHGGVTVNLAGGASISSGANGAASLTLSGSETQINAALATLVYRGAQDWNGADTLSVLSTDSNGLSDSDNLTITVNPINDAPVAIASSATTAEDTSVNGTASSTDVDIGDTASYSLVGAVGGATHGTATMNSDGTWTYSPVANYNGGDSFTYKVVDAAGASSAAVISITVTPVNDAPVNTLPAAQSVSEDTNLPISGLSVHDVDGNLSTVRLTVLHGGVTVDLAGGASISSGANGAATLTLSGSETQINAALATLVYRGAQDWNGADTLSVLSTDSNGLTDSDNLSITVVAVNDAPVALADSATTDEDTPVSGTASSTDADLGDSATYSLVGASGGAAHGTVSINSAGAWTFSPATDYHGSDTFTFKVVDAAGASSTAIVTITINSVNDPVEKVVGGLLDTGASTPEDTALPIPLDSLVYDRDLDPISVSAISVGHGSISYNAGTATFLYTPSLNYNGPDTLSFTANDGTVSSSFNLPITVSPVNDAPVAAAASRSTPNDTALSASVSASDVDIATNADTLTYSLVSGPVKADGVTATGSLTLNSNGTYTFTPAAGFDYDVDGLVTFVFRATDSGGLSSTATVTIFVGSGNSAPVTADDSGSINEDTTLVDAVTGTDIDANPLTYAVVAGPSHGSIAFNVNGSFSYIPALNYNGADSFTFKANDGQLDSNISTYNITVSAVNDAPTFTGGSPQSVVVLEDHVLTGSSPVTDVDGDPLSVSVKTNGVNGTVVVTNAATGTWTFTPNANYRGSDVFTLTASDGHGGTVDQVIYVGVTSVNDAPNAGPDNFVELNEDATYTFAYADFHNPGKFDASFNFYGPYFNDVNDRPMIAGGTYLDADNPLSVIITSLPTAGSLRFNGSSVTLGQEITMADIASGKLSFTPGANQNGNAYSVWGYTMRDDGGTANGGVDTDPSPTTMTMKVAAVNDAPTVSAQSIIVLEDGSFNGSTVAADVDIATNGDSLTFSIGSAAAHGVVNITNALTGTWTYAPTANYNGADSFVITITDSSGAAATQLVSVAVTSVNDAPAGTDKTLTLLEDGSYTFSASDFGFTDLQDSPANSIQSVVIGSLPASGNLTLNGSAVTAGLEIPVASLGNLVWTPAADFNGSLGFNFQVRDNGGTSNGGVNLDPSANTITFSVTAVNDVPVFTAGSGQAVSTLEDQAVSGSSAATDVDADPLSYTVSGAAAHGTAAVNSTTGLWTYTPASNYWGSDTFTVQASDGHGGVTTQLVNVSITSVNDAPAGTDKTLTLLEDGSYTFSASDFGFTDPNDSLAANSLQSVLISTLPASGSLTLNGVAVSAGQEIAAVNLANLVWSPAADYNGSGLNFKFQVRDNGGTANGGVNLDPSANTISFTVTAVNDAAVFAGGNTQTLTVLEDSGANAGSSAASDVDGNVLTWSKSDGSHGTVAVNSGTGVWTYTPAANYFGADSFTVSVNDGTVTTVQTINVTITPVNDAPSGSDKTLTLLEDGSYTFSAADFGFSDTSDNPAANSLQGVIISALPSIGTLKLGASSVSAGQEIPVASLGSLIWTPPANVNGATAATLQFQVRDDGGTSNGGINLDASANTLTFSVTAVNDAPVFSAGSSQNLTTLEDTVLTGNSAATDVDTGDTLSYLVTGAPSHGSVSITAGGAWSYTPGTDYNGTDSFVVRVSDGSVAVTQTINISITSVNDAPTGTDKTITVNEDTARALTAADFGFADAKDSPANSLLSVLITSVPGKGSLALNGTSVTAGSSVIASDIAAGKLVWTPAANENGNGYTSFTFQVRDDGGTSNGGLNLDASANTITFNVTAVNDAPVAQAGSLTMAEDSVGSGSAVATDVDITTNADTLTWSVSSAAAHGSVSINTVTGAYTYTPAVNFNGADSFTFKVLDQSGASSTAVVSITVTPVNDAPVALPGGALTDSNGDGIIDGISTPEDTPKVVALSALVTDIDLDPLSITAISCLHGSASYDPVSGNISYAPASNYNGPDTISFTVTDGTVSVPFPNLPVTVTPVNDAPVAQVASATTSEDVAVSGTATATDVDAGDSKAFTLVGAQGGALHGTVLLNSSTGSWTYTPASNYNGPDAFTFRATDSGGLSSTALVSITVNAINDTPTFTSGASQSVTTLEDTYLDGSSAATDADGNSLVFSVGTAAGHGTVVITNAATGAWSYTPATDYNGADSFVISVNDGQGQPNSVQTQTVSVGITSVNDAPAGTDKTVSMLEDGTYTFSPADFGFTDPKDSPANALQSVIISSLPLNGSLKLGATDVFSGQEITVVNLSSLTWSPAPNANGVGLAGFNFQVRDNGGISNGGANLDASANTITFNVTPVNDLPEVLPGGVLTDGNGDGIIDGFTTPEDTLKSMALSSLVRDIDLDPLSITSISALHGTVIYAPLTGVITYNPDLNYNGVDTITFTVSDGTGTSTFTLPGTVTPVNDAPVANAGSFVTAEDTILSNVVTGSDVDSGDSKTFTLVGSNGGAAHGTLSLNSSTGAFVFTPAADYNGADSFTFKVTDAAGASSTAVISLTITPVNDLPVKVTGGLLDTGFTTPEDTTKTISLAGIVTDIDGDALNVTAISAQHGTASYSGGIISYIPDANYNGADSISFTVSDGTGTQNFTLAGTVTPVNDAPVAQAASVSVNEDTLLSSNFSASDVDIATNADTQSFTLVGGNGGALHGTVIITNATAGTFTYMPAGNYNGTDSFSYRVTDAGGLTSVATVSITVNPVNDLPVVLPGGPLVDGNGDGQIDGVSTPEDTPKTIALSSLVMDPDFDPLTVTSISSTHGTAIFNLIDKTIVFNPDANYNGPASVTLVVSDGTASVSFDLPITVTPVNDAPVSLSQTINLSEATLANSVVATMSASDVDVGDTRSWTITGGNADGKFSINAATGQVRLDNSLDYESKTQYVLNLRVTDAGGLTSDATLTVNVLNVNDNAPVAQDAAFVVREDKPVGFELGTIIGTDADGDALSWTIPVGNIGNAFSIDSSGRLTIATALDRETRDHYTLTVRCGDGTYSDEATVTILVTDANDSPPVVNDQGFSIMENSARGTSVGLVLASDPDSTSVLSYAIEGGNNGGAFKIDAVTGALSVDGSLDYELQKSYVLKLRVSDGTYSDVADITVNVLNENDNAPKITAQSTTIPENAALATKVLTAVASDADGDSVSYTIISGNKGAAFTINSATGDIYVAAGLDADTLPQYQLTVQVTDGKYFDTAVMQINISGINDNAPLLLSGNSAVTPEDTSVHGQLLATDGDGDPISFSRSSLPLHGAVSVSANGGFDYTPAVNYNGQDSFKVLMDDGAGGLTEVTVAVTVTPVNDLPVFTGGLSGAGKEDTVISGVLTASDVDGDALSFASISAPAHGSVSVSSDGAWSYTPAANYNGTDSFQVRVVDGHGGEATAIVNLAISSEADAPTISSGLSGTTPEDTQLNGQIVAVDIDGAGLSYGLAGSTSHGTVSMTAGGLWTYTPAANYNGPDSFLVGISNGSGTSFFTVNLTVTPVNDTPVAADDFGDQAEDSTAEHSVLGNDTDVDGDVLSVARVISATHGSASVIGGSTIRFVPTLDYSGPATVVYEVRDPSGAVSQATLHLTITPVNDAPEALTYNPVSLPEDSTRTYRTVDFFTDRDGDVLTLTASCLHGVIVVDNGAGTFTYTPAVNYNGSERFTLTASDGEAALTINVPVTVTPVNDLPVITGGLSANGAENSTLSGTVLASDVDGDTLRYTALTVPQNGSLSLNPNTGFYTFTPVDHWNGQTSFLVQVDDGAGGLASATVTLTVTSVNDLPTVTGGTSATTPEDVPVTRSVSAVDIEGDPLSYGKASDPAHGSVTVAADGTWTYSPSANWFGTDRFDVSITDGSGFSLTTVTVTVTPVNDAPVANPDFGDQAEDSTAEHTVLANDTDVDLDVLAVNRVVSATHGSASVVGGSSIRFTPDLNYYGPADVVYEAIDPSGAIAQGVLHLTITPVNDAPVQLITNLSTPEDTALTAKMSDLFSDIDGDTVTVLSSSSPKGSVSYFPATGNIRFIPNENFNGLTSITLRITDGDAVLDKTIVVNVTPVNDLPVISGGLSGVTDEDKPVSGTVLAGDVDGDALAYRILSGPANGAASMNLVTGLWQYSPNDNYFGSDSFVVQVDDGNGGLASATVNLTVNSVNDIPVVTGGVGSDRATTPEDTSVSGKLIASDADVADTLSYVQTATAQHGLSVLNPDGSWSYTPALNYNGNDNFTVRVSDGKGGEVVSVVQITVTPVNDVPVTAPDFGDQAEDSTAQHTVVANDSDVDGDVLSTYRVVSATHGTATVVSGGAIQFVPDLNYNGFAVVVYEIRDPAGATAQGTLTINVTPVNDAPVVDPHGPLATGGVITAEDTPIRVKLDDILDDVDGDHLSLVSGTAGHGQVTYDALTNELIYTPALNFNGADAADFTVTDGEAVVSFRLGITVTPVNDAPVITGGLSGVTAEDTALNGRVLATDVDIATNADVLTYNIIGNTAHGTTSLDAATGVWLYAPSLNYNGADSFVVDVVDRAGVHVSATVSLTVTPVNDIPEVVIDGHSGSVLGFTTPEDTAITVKISDHFTDVDHDLLTGVTATAQHGTITWNADKTSFTYLPSKDYNGLDSVTITITDGTSVKSTVLPVVVTPVNDGPQAADDGGEQLQGSEVIYDVLANDSDLETSHANLQLSAIKSVTGGRASMIGNQISFVADPAFVGDAVIVYEMRDADGGTKIARALIKVLEIPNPAKQTLLEDSAKAMTVEASLGSSSGLNQRIGDGEYTIETSASQSMDSVMSSSGVSLAVVNRAYVGDFEAMESLPTMGNFANRPSGIHTLDGVMEPQASVQSPLLKRLFSQTKERIRGISESLFSRK